MSKASSPVTLALLLVVAYGDSSTPPSTDSGVDSGPDTLSVPAGLVLTLERLAPGVDFKAVVISTGAAPSSIPTITSDRGVVSPVTDIGDGRFEATITTDGTGEYVVEATLEGESASDTAVVLELVGARWGQPRKVRGLVNTDGWEDSIYITPDGEWLFLVYSPVSITCTWEFDDSPGGADNTTFCATASGPWEGPERPNLGGAERIGPRGEVSPECLGVTPGVFLPPATTYGFHRQADGSFAEPFVMSFPGSGGCLTTGGLNVYPNADGSAHALFSWNDWNPPGIEFVVADIPVLGRDFEVAAWVGTFGAGGAVEGFVGTELPIPHALGELGFNAHGVWAADGISRVWFDNETGERDLYYAERGADGRWTPPATMGAPLSTPGGEIMPFYSASRMYVRLQTAAGAHTIASSSFIGGPTADPTDAMSWGPYETDLAGDVPEWFTEGAIFTVAEPTVTSPALTADGEEILYFNYAVRAADGSADLNVGYVVTSP